MTAALWPAADPVSVLARAAVVLARVDADLRAWQAANDAARYADVRPVTWHSAVHRPARGRHAR